jgi:hypothetical protein
MTDPLSLLAERAFRQLPVDQQLKQLREVWPEFGSLPDEEQFKALQDPRFYPQPLPTKETVATELDRLATRTSVPPAPTPSFVQPRPVTPFYAREKPVPGTERLGGVLPGVPSPAPNLEYDPLAPIPGPKLPIGGQYFVAATEGAQMLDTALRAGNIGVMGTLGGGASGIEALGGLLK